MHGIADLARLTGSVFISGLWQGTLLAAAVWLCLRLVPRTTAALRFALWTSVLLVVALLPVLESIFSGHEKQTPHAMLQVDLRWSMALAALWASLSMYRGLSLGVQGYRLWALYRQASPVALPEEHPFSLLAHGRDVELCTSTQVERPGVIGFFAPRILIPGWLYPQLTAPELHQIVLHELEHLRRRDDWLNLLQKLWLVAFPLNPVLIAIERLLCRERELACDAGVLRRTHAPRRYATCLATLAERGLDRLKEGRLSLALGTLGERHRQSELGRRVQRILQRETAMSPLGTRVLTATVALVLAGSAAGLARCPQIVSFVAAHPPQVAAAQPTFVSPPAVSSTVPAQLWNVSLPAKPGPRVLRTVAPKATRPRKQAMRPLELPLILSSWTSDSHPRIVTLGYDLPLSGSFAALRIEGGWLFVQL